MDLFGHDKEIERLLRHIIWLLEYITFPRVRSFIIEQETQMALTPLAPGFSPVFTATPVPAGAVLNPSQPIPSWTASDPANIAITTDPTGLIATVAIGSATPVGESITLTVSYTNVDGTVATGTLTFTVVAAPPVDVTSFTIAQTS